MSVGFLGKRGLFWALVASYLIPALMTGAYIVLMYTSDTDNTGKAWESVGLAFVLVLWWLFRLLTEHAAMARAVAIGDADRVLDLSDRQLRRRRRAVSRVPYHVYRALAFEIRGEWTPALAALDEAPLDRAHASWRVLAATVRVAAFTETGKVAEARAAFDRDLKIATRDRSAAILARLAEARLLLAEGARPEAEALLRKLVDDVRAGIGTRGAAHYYLYRLTNDAAQLAKAKQLAPSAWFAR